MHDQSETTKAITKRHRITINYNFRLNRFTISNGGMVIALLVQKDIQHQQDYGIKEQTM
jgi:hypothetical protein